MSTADRISTTGQIVLKSETYDNNAVSGDSTTRIYTGSRAQMIAQRAVEIGFGASIIKLESTGDGNYQLTAGYTWDILKGGNAQAPANNVHELDITMNQVEVWTNPKLRATFVSAFGSAAAANAAIAFVVKTADNFIKTGDGSATAQGVAESLITAAYPTDPQQAVALNAFRGVAYHQVKNCIQFDTVYRRRITAASYNQVQASFIGAGKIWTTAEILAFENVPSAWWFQLPSTYLWLKAQPMVNTVAQQKTEITYNYIAVAEAWDLLYDAYNSAELLTFA